MSNTESLAGSFLVAMPQMLDPNFNKTVTLICQHDENGALGVVINRRSEFPIGEVFKQLELSVDRLGDAGLPVYIGGPVHPEVGLVLHTFPGEWESSLIINDRLALTSSRDILESLAAGGGPRQRLLTLGYAGWGAGQLEYEMQQNAWLNAPLDESLVFSTPPEQRWQHAARLLGIDISLLSTEAGHA
ncbi:MAG: YqgE/AlgH family protein [Pseudomonadota bacterium]|nr:YqgE/AlgH family protein [Pseudomonadota bacterium]